MTRNSPHSAASRAIWNRIRRPSIPAMLIIAVIVLASVAAYFQTRGSGAPDTGACQALSRTLQGDFADPGPTSLTANGQTCEGTDGITTVSVTVIPESRGQSPGKLYNAQVSARSCTPVTPQPSVFGANAFYSCRFFATSTRGGVQTVALEVIGGAVTYVQVRFTSDQEVFPDSWSATAATEVLAYLANNAKQAA